MTRPDFADATWRKACGDGASCVQVAQVGTWVGVRDSQDDKNSTILVFKREAWMAFVVQCGSREH